MRITCEATDGLYYSNFSLSTKAGIFFFLFDDLPQVAVKRFAGTTKESAMKRARIVLRALGVKGYLTGGVSINRACYPPKWDNWQEHYYCAVKLEGPVPPPQYYDYRGDTPSEDLEYIWSLWIDKTIVEKVFLKEFEVHPLLVKFLLGIATVDGNKYRTRVKNKIVKQFPLEQKGNHVRIWRTRRTQTILPTIN